MKPWHMGTHQRVLSKSFPMNTNMTRFRGGFRKSLHPCALDKNSLSSGRVKSVPLMIRGCGNLPIHAEKLSLTSNTTVQSSHQCKEFYKKYIERQLLGERYVTVVEKGPSYECMHTCLIVRKSMHECDPINCLIFLDVDFLDSIARCSAWKSVLGAGPSPCKIHCVALSTLFQVLPRAIVSIVVQFQWRPAVAGSAPRSF